MVISDHSSWIRNELSTSDNNEMLVHRMFIVYMYVVEFLSPYPFLSVYV